MSETIFNHNNDAYLTADYPIFLGQPLAMYDSMNTIYPKLFEYYEQMKSQDWSHREVNLEQSRLDFLLASPSETECAIENLLWQWEADSRVSRSIGTLLSPFVSNNEAWAAISKQSEMEVLHGLTYSEIARQCISDPTTMIKRVMENQEVLKRSSTIEGHMAKLERLGAMKRLGMPLDDGEVEDTLMLFMVGLLSLEGLEFMASFACTFALAERGLFMGVAQLVQKIMLDEIVHSKVDLEIIKSLLESDHWVAVKDRCKGEIKNLLDEVVSSEEAWSDYIFSQGRSIVGLNQSLLKEWVYYCAKSLYDFLGIPYDFPVVTKNPIAYMDKWMDIDSQQNANQEQDNSQYLLNTLVHDDEAGKSLGVL